MAAATAKLTITPDSVPYNTWSDGKKQHVIGTIAIDASTATYPAGGIPLNFTDEAIKSRHVRLVLIISAGGAYAYKYDATAGTIRIFDLATNAEFTTNAAIAAGISGDTITVYAIFDQLR